MILSLFTVRHAANGSGVYHQIHHTHESDDLSSLIAIGREWENDELKQYYNIRFGGEDKNISKYLVFR